MFGLSGFISFLRDAFRPGALHFVKDPQSEDAQPIRELVEVPTRTQLNKLSRSALMYGSTILVSLGVVSWGGRYFFPSVLPLRWHPGRVLIRTTSLNAQTLAFGPSVRARGPRLRRPHRGPSLLEQLRLVRSRADGRHDGRRATTASLLLPLRQTCVGDGQRSLTWQA